jgi:5-methylcytosine-specific restriction endonuclease McrA
MSVPRPTRRCSHPACVKAAHAGTSRCAEHAAVQQAERFAHLHSAQGISKERRRIRYGARYQAQRKRVLARDEQQCVSCGSAGPLEVHHIVEADVVEDEELVTLCRSCHMRIGRGDSTVAARLARLGWGATGGGGRR